MWKWNVRIRVVSLLRCLAPGRGSTEAKTTHDQTSGHPGSI